MDNHVMSCIDIGTAGNCGFGCPLFLSGDCIAPKDFEYNEIVEEFGEKDALRFNTLYGDIWHEEIMVKEWKEL